MKKSLLLLIIFLGSLSSFSQENDRIETFRPIQFFLGIQPEIDIRDFDGIRSYLDINVIPVSIEYAVNQRWRIKITPSAIMQFKPELPSEISRVGSGLTIPYHFSKKNSEEGHRGFYAGPHGALNMHRLDNFMSTTLAGEIGYCFLFNSVLSLNIGVQGGRTYQFDPNGGYAVRYNHSAAVFTFGFWF